ncbi:MAG: sensor histidine kinase, partial [Nocardioidaceae bacterium]
MGSVRTLLAVAAVIGVIALVLWWFARRRGDFGTPADRATFRTLHTASLASPPLRAGLTTASAERSLRHLRTLLGAPATALTDLDGTLAWEGGGEHHRSTAYALARETIGSGSTSVTAIACGRPGCALRHVITAPLTVDERVAGTLQVFAPVASVTLIRATNEVAGWVSGQLELAEVDESRRRLVEAEVRALRAQISPHFIYN